jgi:hypothetical protein
MKNFSVFKRYETGERASRLYLKNLVAKVTSEQVMERKTKYKRLCMSKQLKRKWKIMCQLKVWQLKCLCK